MLSVQIHFHKSGISIFDWGMGFFNDFGVKLKFLQRRPRFANRLVSPKLLIFISYLTPKRIFHWYMIIFSLSITCPYLLQWLFRLFLHTHITGHIHTPAHIHLQTYTPIHIPLPFSPNLMHSSRSTSIFSFLQVAPSRFSSLFQFLLQSFFTGHILSP